MVDRPQDVLDALDVLRQARARLQGLLEADEHWRALTRGPTPAGEADAAARRARDTRLEMALATNAAYRAWRYVGDAIAILSPERASPPPVPSAAAVPTDTGELPPHIADLLRRRAAEEARLAEARRATQRAPELPASPVTNAPAPAPQMPPREAEKNDHVPGDAEEAAVTFVAREPVVATEGGRPPALRERLRALAAAGAPTATFSPPQAGAEEAEVEILSTEAVRERRTDAERTAAVERFRKMLLGE
jgi:hypothetical protein